MPRADDLMVSASPLALDVAAFRPWSSRERRFGFFLKPEECRAFGDTWADLDRIIAVADVRWDDSDAELRRAFGL